MTPASVMAPESLGERPLFRGYALVVFVGAWLLGDWLCSLGALVLIAPLGWLALAGAGLAASGACALLARRTPLASRARRAARLGLTLAALLFWIGLGAGRAAWSNPARDPLNIARFADGSQAQVVGQVVDQPDERDGYRLLTVQVSAITPSGATASNPASGRIEATVYGPNDWFSPTYGDSVELTGALKPLSGGGPVSVDARMSSARVTITARGGGWAPLAALFRLRVALAQAIERSLPEPEAALLIGILLGLKSPALRARLPLFVNTGTIHLVVPAGLKVSLLAEFASRSARRLGYWPRSVAALAAVGVYAALGGGGPAAIRAAIMGALLALAPALGRAYNVYTALALATFIMTVIEPALLYDAGFQLTVMATFALPLLTPALQQALLRPLGRFARLGVAQIVAESFAVTLAAQAATLPTLALTFHVVSLVAPLANLLTVPLLAPLLALGGLLALAAALGWSLLALALAWLIWPLLWWVNAAIASCAALPLAALQTPPASAALAALYYAVLVALLVALAPRLASATRALADDHGHRRARHPLVGHVLTITLGLALLGSLGASAPTLAASQRAHLDILDVGPGGAAILLRLRDGAAVLIDGGPSGPMLESALGSRLPFWRRSLDVVALTDARAGDARGLEDLAAHDAIAHALDAGLSHPTPEYLAYLDAMRAAGATRQQFRAGDTLSLDATTTLTSLAPPQTLYPPNEGDTAASDDAILRLETPGLTALLLGAADTYALDALTGSGQPLTADLVIVAVPRGAPLDLAGPLGEILRLAHPRAVIVTDAPLSASHIKTVKLSADMWQSDADVAAATGAQVYRISDTGALSLSGDASGWTLG